MFNTGNTENSINQQMIHVLKLGER